MKKVIALILSMALVVMLCGVATAVGIEDWTVDISTDYSITSGGLNIKGSPAFTALYNKQVNLDGFTAEFTFNKLGTYQDEGDHWFALSFMQEPKFFTQIFVGPEKGFAFLLRPAKNGEIVVSYHALNNAWDNGAGTVISVDPTKKIKLQIVKDNVSGYKIYLNEEQISFDFSAINSILSNGKAYFSMGAHDANSANTTELTISTINGKKIEPAPVVAEPVTEPVVDSTDDEVIEEAAPIQVEEPVVVETPVAVETPVVVEAPVAETPAVVPAPVQNDTAVVAETTVQSEAPVQEEVTQESVEVTAGVQAEPNQTPNPKTGAAGMLAMFTAAAVSGITVIRKIKKK